MKRLWWIPFAAAAVLLLIMPFPGAPRPTTRHITMEARSFEYGPGRVHVNRGDRVIIEIQAADVVHGFYLDGYGIERQIVPGIPERIEFIADKAGKFRYRCSVSCGTLHPFMIGELVVDANTPFWRAAGLISLAVLGMMVYWWRKQEETYGSETR